jgi:UDP-N-acetyl-D-mannosaminuronic acid dehydrogenase
MVLEAGAELKVHDPHVLNYPDVELLKDSNETIKGADAVVIFTGHKEYFSLKPEDIKKLTGKENTVIIDGRNVIDPDTFINAGFVYKGIGRGDKNSHPINQ